MFPVVDVHLSFAELMKDLSLVHLLPGLFPSAVFANFLHVAASPSAAFVSFLHVAVSPLVAFEGFLRVAAAFASFAVTPSTVFANFLRVAASL